jgi:hypothetical protein
MTILFHFSGAQKCAVFAQFWEAEGSSTSHLFIDNQSVDVKTEKRKKTAQREAEMRVGWRSVPCSA